MDLIVNSPNRLQFKGKSYACVIGRGGFTTDKREGDGATPIGRFSLRSLRYRSDRLERPQTRLPVQALHPDDGWCDDPAHKNYNRPVTLPFQASHEKLWRDDDLYNLIVDLGYNDDPPRPGLGSAIFLHVKNPQSRPTKGCVALAQDDLLEILKECGTETHVGIVAGT